MPSRLFRSQRTLGDLTVILAASCVMCGGHSTDSAAKDVCAPGQSIACTGPSLGSECGLCDEGTIDSAHDSLNDASAIDAPYMDVMSEDVGEITSGDAGICATCGPASVCVEDQTVGGADAGPPDDAGHCIPGYVPRPGSNSCERPPSFHCAALPSSCFPPGAAAPAHCVCAPALCPIGQGFIGSPSKCTDLSPSMMLCLTELS